MTVSWRRYYLNQIGQSFDRSCKLHVHDAAGARNTRAMNTAVSQTRYRSIFISDFHLGTRGCRSEFLADFLRRVSCDNLFLVGDIIDGWRLRKSWYWDENHDEVLRLILRHARATGFPR